MSGHRTRRATLWLVMCVAAAVVPAAHAEETTVEAAMTWQAKARVFVTGSQQAYLLGVFGGRLAVERSSSPLDRAQLVCPAAFDADYAGKTVRGEGRCVITTLGGDRLFARWTCAGEPATACAGRGVVTGGTGAFQGASGDGEFVIQMLLSEPTSFDRQEIEYDLAGTAAWRGLKYRTP